MEIPCFKVVAYLGSQYARFELGFYAVLNIIQAEKDIVISYDAGHWNYPEVWLITDEWLSKKIFQL